MARLDLAKPRHAALAKLDRALDQPFLFNDFQRREACRARDGALFVRVVAERGLRRAVEAARRQNRRKRHDPAAETLADDENVRRRAELLAGVERSCARKAARNFIEDQERAMPPGLTGPSLPRLAARAKSPLRQALAAAAGQLTQAEKSNTIAKLNLAPAYGYRRCHGLAAG
jgi:hypothetical protein